MLALANDLLGDGARSTACLGLKLGLAAMDTNELVIFPTVHILSAITALTSLQELLPILGDFEGHARGERFFEHLLFDL